MPGSNLLPSILRTFVPLLVGAVMSILLRVSDTVDSDAVTTLVTAAVTGLYYLIIRILEYRVKPAFGWLLGYPVQPVYAPERDQSGRFVSRRASHADAGVGVIYVIGLVVLVFVVLYVLMFVVGRV